MNSLVDRFLHYTSLDTQSDENSVTFPSTEKQFALAHELDVELQSLGLGDSSVDPNCYVTATLPANCESPETVPIIAFLAHMDTSPDASGMGVKPRIITAYDGCDILISAEKNMILSPTDFPDMLLHKGEDFRYSQQVEDLRRELAEKDTQLDAQVTEWIAAVNERNIAWKKIGALMVLVKEALRDHGPWRGYDEEMRTWETRARKAVAA